MGKTRKLFWLVFFFLTLIGSSLLEPKVLAKEDEKTNNVLGFSYIIEQPDNQREQGQFFSLNMLPGQKQTLTVWLQNNDEKELEVQVKLNQATTNGLGEVEYSENDLRIDSSARFDFLKIITGPKTVKIPPKKTVPLKFKVEMPQERYQGVILGGVEFSKKEHAVNSENLENNTIGIKNKYNYVFSISLWEDPIENFVPNIEFKEFKISKKAKEVMTVLQIVNPQMAILKNYKISGVVKESHSQKVVGEKSISGANFAPNTIMDYSVPLDSIGDGKEDYQLDLIVESEDGKQWNYHKKFRIPEKFTLSEDDQNISDPSDGRLSGISFGLKTVLIVLLAAGLVMVIYYLLKRIRLKKD